MGHFSNGRLKRCFYCVGKMIKMLSDFRKNHCKKYLISEVLKLVNHFWFCLKLMLFVSDHSGIKYIETFLRNTMQLEIHSTIISSCSMHIGKSRLVQLGRSSWGFYRWYLGMITNFWDVLEKRVIYIVVNGTTES